MSESIKGPKILLTHDIILIKSAFFRGKYLYFSDYVFLIGGGIIQSSDLDLGFPISDYDTNRARIVLMCYPIRIPYVTH